MSPLNSSLPALSTSSEDEGVALADSIGNDTDQNLMELESKMLSVCREMEKLDKSLEHCRAQDSVLQKRVAELHTIKEVLEADIASRKVEWDEVGLEIESRKCDCQTLIQRKEELDSCVRELTEKLSAVNDSNAESVRSYENQLESLKAATFSAEQLLASKDLILKDADAEIKQLNHKIAQKNQEYSILCDSHQSLLNEKQSVELSLEQTIVNRETLEATVRDVQTRLESLVATINAKNTELNQLKTDIECCQRQKRSIELLTIERDQDLKQLIERLNCRNVEHEQLITEFESASQRKTVLEAECLAIIERKEAVLSLEAASIHQTEMLKANILHAENDYQATRLKYQELQRELHHTTQLLSEEKHTLSLCQQLLAESHQVHHELLRDHDDVKRAICRLRYEQDELEHGRTEWFLQWADKSIASLNNLSDTSKP